MSRNKISTTHEAEALIAGVDADDLARARAEISQGVQAAQKQWVPTHLIVSALALELQEQIAGEDPSNELSLYLRRLSEFVGSHADTKARH